MTSTKTTPKAEETGRKILDAALELFRQQGFDATTMRNIAQKAEVATGATYYYYPSKDGMVMDFYRRSCAEMQPRIEAALAGAHDLETRLQALIQVKLTHFAPHRGVLRSLLREIDIAWFGRILADCGLRIPRDLAPQLPSVLWFFQMGVIFFWVVDESPHQARTARLLQLATKSVVFLIRVSALPLLRPLRKTALQLIETVKGEPGSVNS
jgi:AcrR family transcriptional regulator